MKVLSAFSLKIEVEIIHDEVILSTKRIAYIGSSVFEVLLLCSFCQKPLSKRITYKINLFNKMNKKRSYHTRIARGAVVGDRVSHGGLVPGDV